MTPAESRLTEEVRRLTHELDAERQEHARTQRQRDDLRKWLDQARNGLLRIYHAPRFETPPAGAPGRSAVIALDTYRRTLTPTTETP